MHNFTNQTMISIIEDLKDKLPVLNARETIDLEVLNPDVRCSTYAGSLVEIDGLQYVYRGYKTWVDLAQSLQCKMLTPKINSKNTVILTFEKLNINESFHNVITDKEEKYGSKSIFSSIHKNEESSFIYYYLEALHNVGINKRKRILNLGVNSGDEFEVIQHVASNFKKLELVGIDYCSSAISQAAEKFKNYENVSFYNHDIKNLASLELGRFDLIISVGTLQSSNLEFNDFLMSIVQNQLKPEGAMILGLPNCRWDDGEMIYGAKVKNYPYCEMGLLYKDAIFCKKYLQQKKFRVTITGKDYIFITATSIRK